MLRPEIGIQRDCGNVWRAWSPDTQNNQREHDQNGLTYRSESRWVAKHKWAGGYSKINTWFQFHPGRCNDGMPKMTEPSTSISSQKYTRNVKISHLKSSSSNYIHPKNQFWGRTHPSSKNIILTIRIKNLRCFRHR